MRSLDVALKCSDVTIVKCDVENRRPVNRSTRTVTSSQTVSIDLTFSRSLDRGYGAHAGVNVASTNSVITRIRQLTSTRSPKITD